MKKKSFVCGFLSCALVMALGTTALAASTKTAELWFNDIKLMVNGEIVEVTDSTGAKTEPFIINGTTYLPVGNVAKMVGYNVKWDGANNTVILEAPGYVAPAEPEAPSTLEQENALASAKKYLNYTSFSRQGLIEQLEYEQYSKAAATWAVDNCGANWNEQAAKTAEKYLKYSSFSRQGLIDQLEYEGFTHEQALYGVEQVGY